MGPGNWESRMALSLWRNSTFPSKCLANFQQIRTNTHTAIVERVHEVRPVKPNKIPILRQKNYVYKTLQDTFPTQQKTLSVLLKKYVEDVGQAGEIVTVPESKGRFLIMTHKAGYTSEENIKKYAAAAEQHTYSSKYVLTTMNMLKKFVLNICMNKENAWTLEKWHIKSAFRKAGVVVPESAITMPEYVISGPDMALENKEFYVTVTINDQEKVIVRARIHHWATTLNDRLPRVRDHWKFPVETVFAEDKEILKTLPEMIPPVFDDDDNKVYKPIVRKK